MEKQILAIFGKRDLSCSFEDYAKDIAVFIESKYVEKEFAEWVAADCVKLWNKADVYQEIETHKTFKGIKKLYQYWLTAKQ